MYDEVVFPSDWWQLPAREQANPVLQKCIMISQGAIGCSSLFGANFLDCWHCGPWLRPSTQMPVIACGRGAGFVRLCPVTFHQEEHNTMRQTTISWLLLVIKLIEKRGCVWNLGVANKCMWQRAYPWLAVAMWEKEYLCAFDWECISMCVCVCVRDNPAESRSLKGNRCRFTYVEGPQPVMRLVGLDLSSQQLKGAYLINAWS